MRSKELIKRVDKTTIGISEAESNTYDIFIRGEHPDTRSNAEFLRDLQNKLFKKGYRKKQRAMIPILCHQNGKEYRSYNAAERDLGLCDSCIGKHFKGLNVLGQLKGYTFEIL